MAISSYTYMPGGSVRRRFVSPDKLAKRLNISKEELAKALGLPNASICTQGRAQERSTQCLLRDMAAVMDLAIPWTGSERAALRWYCSRSLPSFGGQTAQSLVHGGQAKAVKTYLDRISHGGFA